MNPGDAIGPATLVEVIANDGPITRCRGRIGDDPAEILVVDADAPTEVVERFQRAHEALTRVVHPDVLVTHWLGRLDDGRTAAVRDWSTPAVAPEDSAEAVDAMRTLLPAVRAAGPALLSETSPRDLRRRDDGRLVVAPWGARSPTDTPHRAPESHRDGPDTDTSALYGLGVWLYRGVTEHLPVPAGVRTDEAPPSPPTKWRPDLPFNLSQALMALVAEAPATRMTALGRLDTHAPPATAVPGKVKLTTRAVDAESTPPRHARLDTPDTSPGAVLTVRAHDLAALTAAEQSALAGWAEIPVRVVRDAASSGRSLPIGGLATSAAARQQLTTLRHIVDVPVSLTTPPSALRLLGMGALATVGVATVALALILGVWWVALFSLMFFALGLVSAGTWVAGARAFRSVSGQLPALTTATVPALQRASKRTASLRRRLASLELPSTAESDVRDAITSVEDQIEAVARVHSTIDDPTALEEQLVPIRSALDALETSLPTEARLMPEERLQQVHHATVSVRRAMAERSL